MLKEQFEKKIQDEISPDLYLEETQFEDLDRVMFKREGKSPVYVCAFPRAGVREDFDPSYVSARDIAFPSREQLEAKVADFINQFPDNADLYE